MKVSGYALHFSMFYPRLAVRQEPLNFGRCSADSCELPPRPGQTIALYDRSPRHGEGASGLAPETSHRSETRFIVLPSDGFYELSMRNHAQLAPFSPAACPDC